MNKQRLSYIATILLITFLLGTVIGQAQTPTVTTWLQPGSLTETETYVFWVDGSNYFRKNGETAQIISNTNVTVLTEDVMASNISLLFKDGTYSLSAPINVTGVSYVDVSGSGPGTLFTPVDNYGYDAVIAGYNSTYVNINNLNIHGNKAGVVRQANGIWLVNTNSSTISNCIVTNNENHGIYIYQSNSVTVNNNAVSDNDGYGINTYLDSSRIIYTSNMVVSNNESGLRMDDVNDAVISANIGDDNLNSVTFFGDGIDIFDCVAVTISGNELSESNTGVGIYNSTRIEVSGGAYTNNRLHGFYVEFSSLVSITGPNVFGNGKDGILFNGTQYSVITGGTVYHNGVDFSGYDGIKLTDTGGDPYNIFNTITSVLSFDNFSPKTQNWGINEVTGDFNTIIGANCYYNNVSGIFRTGGSTHIAQSWNASTWLGNWNGTAWEP